MKVVEDGQVVEYEYDDDNIRVSQTVGGEKTSFLLDKNRPYDQVLAEYTDGSLDASYVYGLDLISQERNGDDSFYVVDGLGSTRGLTDGEGEVTDAYWYDAYGNLLEYEGNSENDYLFAGEQFDEQLGQYYLRQRYYDATTGRFTRRDTYEGNNLNPITLHKYLYANGNPVNGIDPTGLFTMGEISAASKIANTLNGIQFEYGSHLFFATTSGGDYDGGDVINSSIFALASIVGFSAFQAFLGALIGQVAKSMRRSIGPGVGGNGVVSHFGDITGLSFDEADTFFQAIGGSKKATPKYITYRFPDKSRIDIEIANGRVIRTPSPSYDPSSGRNLTKGKRVGKDGSLLQTRRSDGSFIDETHDTGERLRLDPIEDIK